MKRILLLPAISVAVLAATATAAMAGLHLPRLGSWEAETGVTFKVVKGTGRYVGKEELTGLRITTSSEDEGCPEQPETATLVGKFPIKVYTRGGYSTWGVGHNVKGEAEPIPVKYTVAGATVAGTLRMVWDYEHPAIELIGGTLSIGPCTVYTEFGGPKK